MVNAKTPVNPTSYATLSLGHPWRQRLPLLGTFLTSILLTFVLSGCVTQLSNPGNSGTVAPLTLANYVPVPSGQAVVASEEGTAPEIAIAMAAAREGRIADAETSMEEMGLTVDNLQDRAVLLSYNGEVIADKRLAVVAETGGMALLVNVEVGDVVQKGDVLVQIDSTILEAERAQSLASLQAAQASLELLTQGPSEEELAAVEASVAAAQASYSRALRGPEAEDARIALANLQQTEAEVRRAQSAYDDVKWRANIAALPQSAQLQQATLALEIARAEYEKATKGGTQDAVASAFAQLASSKANLARLLEGPNAAQMRAAEAQVQQAETNLYLAQLQLDKAKVIAPIDGIVTSVNTMAGAMVGQGSPVVTLISSDTRVTIPVEEARMDEIEIGQPALIRVDAHPDTPYAGIIAIIAPELDPATRTVQVTIRPTDDVGGLMPGMFAVVDLLEN